LAVKRFEEAFLYSLAGTEMMPARRFGSLQLLSKNLRSMDYYALGSWGWLSIAGHGRGLPVIPSDNETAPPE
jgi:hypothetical protein